MQCLSMGPCSLPSSHHHHCAVQRQRAAAVSAAALVPCRRAPAARRHICQSPQCGHAAAAAAAAAGAAGQPTSQRFRWRDTLFGWLPGRSSLALLADAWSLLVNNLWAVVLLFLAKDAAAFMLHRLVHRLTNGAAEALLQIPISSFANPWWIVADPKFMDGHIGYQVFMGVAFLLALPVNILFNTAAVSTAAACCVNRQAALDGPGVPTASFTGQGRGKVGLADYPRPPSTHSSYDEGDSTSTSSPLGSMAAAAAAAAILSELAGGSGAATAGSVGGSGAATFRQAPCVSFRPAAAAASAASAQPSSSSSAAAEQPQQPAVPPPVAPALPWLTVVQERDKPPPLLSPRASLAAAHEAWRAQVAGRLRQLWRVDVLFNCWALPLQAACLAVLPTFWAFPRLLRIQLSLPAAVLGGARGRDALDASRSLMAGFESAYAWPFVVLIVAARVLELTREFVLLAMPNRWWTEVPEVPLVATAAFAAARVLLLRLQDLLPLAAYLLLRARQQQQQQQPPATA